MCKSARTKGADESSDLLLSMVNGKDGYLIDPPGCILDASSSSSVGDVFVTSTDDSLEDASLFPVIHANSNLNSGKGGHSIHSLHHLNHHQHLIGYGDREREEYLLSTVIEEEQEPDSLEEFIKHEQQCQLDNGNGLNGAAALGGVAGGTGSGERASLAGGGGCGGGGGGGGSGGSGGSASSGGDGVAFDGKVLLATGCASQKGTKNGVVNEVDLSASINTHGFSSSSSSPSSTSSSAVRSSATPTVTIEGKNFHKQEAIALLDDHLPDGSKDADKKLPKNATIYENNPSGDSNGPDVLVDGTASSSAASATIVDSTATSLVLISTSTAALVDASLQKSPLECNKSIASTIGCNDTTATAAPSSTSNTTTASPSTSTSTTTQVEGKIFHTTAIDIKPVTHETSSIDVKEGSSITPSSTSLDAHKQQEKPHKPHPHSHPPPPATSSTSAAATVIKSSTDVTPTQRKSSLTSPPLTTSAAAASLTKTTTTTTTKPLPASKQHQLNQQQSAYCLRQSLMSEIENHSGVSQLNPVRKSEPNNKMSSSAETAKNFTNSSSGDQVVHLEGASVNSVSSDKSCKPLPAKKGSGHLINGASVNGNGSHLGPADQSGGQGRPNFLLMRSPLPDSDIVTSLTFESIEVPTDDGIELDSSSPSSGPGSPAIKDESNSKCLANFAGEGAANAKGKLSQSTECKTSDACNKSHLNGTLSSSSLAKAGKVVTSGSVKELIEKRKAANANSNLNNGLTNSKRSTSNKDLREKNEAEVKIAQEIIELKQREEELKQMRQARLKIHSADSVSSNTSSGEKKTSSSNSSTASVTKTTSCSDVSSVDIETGRCSPSNSEISTTESVSGRISVDSFDSSNSSAPRISSKVATIKNNIVASSIRSTKPYAPMEETTQVSTTQFTNESPIEREIRLAKQREDELKRQRGESPGSLNDTSASSDCNSNRHPEGDAVDHLAKRGAPATSSIQKVLATTRIQQEIEEQTQREMALKAVGSIKTISQERTDTKIVPTKLSSTLVTSPSSLVTPSVQAAMTNGKVETVGPIVPVVGPPAAAPVAAVPSSVTSNGPTTQVSVINSKATNATTTKGQLGQGPVVNGGVGNTNGTSTNGVVKPNVSPTSSLIPSVSAIKMGFVNQFTKNTNGANSISMHRFISSKGKSTGPCNGSNLLANRFASHQNLCFNSSTNDYTIHELKPPKLAKQFVAANGTRRGSISAETKIQEELKEMKAREEELR